MNQPNDFARYLATYLDDNQHRYTEEEQAAIHQDELAYIIQEFMDTLP
jgi:hypothetical protein